MPTMKPRYSVQSRWASPPWSSSVIQLECIPSFYALREEVRRTDPDRRSLDMADSLKRYTAFYRAVLKVKDSILLVRFEDVIDDYGVVILRLNQRFGTSFALFDHSEPNIARLFASSGSHLSPSSARSGDNQRGRALYDQSPLGLRAAADAAYSRARAVAGEHAGGA